MAVKSSDQITIADLTDAYSIMLSMDAVSLNGSTNKLGTAQSVIVNVSCFRGEDQLTPTVEAPTCPTNVTASVGTPANSMVPVTINFNANLASSGKVTIPVTIGEISINKEFSFSISFKGQTGGTGPAGSSVTVSNVAYAYQLSTSGTTVPTGEWKTTPQAPTTTQYAWTRTTTTYSDGSTAVTYTVGGKTGTNGTSPTVSSSKTQYQKSTSGTTVPTGTWSDSPLAPDVSNYVWTKTTVTYSNGNTAVSYAVAGKQGQQGPQGDSGADAITIAISASNGNIFKNSSGSTVLTAHVYKAGEEVTGSALSALGAIKWYKDNGTTAIETGASLTVNASDVNSKATYTAKLEG